MWMCDGKENQTALADDLGSVVPAVPSPWTWVTAFFEVLRLEWDTLDRFRFDKYMYLVRVYLRKTLELALSAPEQWDLLVQNLMEKCCFRGLALAFHILDVFEEERPVKKRKITLRLMKPLVEFLAGVKLQHVADAVYAKVLEKFLAKEKYKEKVRKMIQAVLAQSPERKETCGVQTLQKCLTDPEPIPTPAPVEELPAELQSVMQRFYPTPSPKKRRSKPDFIPSPTEPKNFEDISVPLPTPMKKKSVSDQMDSAIGSGVKKRKVMFNLKLNTTQREMYTDFGKDEVVAKEDSQPVPVAPKGVLKVQAAMKTQKPKRQ